MMDNLIDTLINFDDSVLRGIKGNIFDPNVFDDLSENKKMRSSALTLSQNNVQFSAIQYNAIDFIFKKTSWNETRFGTGKFPVWYASLELETAFKESAYRWRRRLLGDANYQGGEEILSMNLVVFDVTCSAPLIDLREKAREHSFLIQPDITRYQKSQALGRTLYERGVPGLLTASARKQFGSNVAIFNDRVLHNPKLSGEYLFEILPENKFQVKITDLKKNDILEPIE